MSTGRPLATLVLWLCLAALPAATQADYQSGLDAYNAGRYAAALDHWKAVVAQPPTAVPPATYAEAHYAIGMLYWLGQGVAVDFVEAAKWTRKAANLGNAGAQGKLGYMYTEGITVEKDYDQAFSWLSKAAKQGDVDGQYNLGIFYLNGWGTPQDKTMAAQYLAAASARGDANAEAVLAGLLPELSPAPATRPASKPPTPQSASLLPASWILKQNPDHYTIQVIGLSTIAKLEALVKGHDTLKPFATYTIHPNNRPLYMLVQGNYPSLNAARKARNSFPASIQKPGALWIRSFGEVQKLIQQ